MVIKNKCIKCGMSREACLCDRCADCGERMEECECEEEIV